MYDSVRVGDRVVIKETLALADRSFIGREGTVSVVDAASVVVEVQDLHSESITSVVASEVVKASEKSPVAVGDRVVIRAVRNPNCERYVGRTGRIEHVFIAPDLKGSYKVVLDRGFAARIIASAVEAIPERDQRELSTSEHVLYAAENHDWRDEEAAVEKLHRYGIIDAETLSAELRRINDECSRTAPDKKRTQAAEFAHRTLGTDALLEDVIGLADWILAETEEKVTGAEQTADRFIFTRGGFIPGPNVGPLVDEQPQEPPSPPANLRIKDTYGDAVHFRCVTDRPDTVAFIVGAPAGTYVTPEDADRIIAFLQDAKSARNT